MADKYRNVVFRPDGMAFNSDEEDEPVDDFVFGTHNLDHQTKSNSLQRESINVDRSRTGDNISTTTSMGFGAPTGYISPYNIGGVPPELSKKTDYVHQSGRSKTTNQQPRRRVPHTKQVKPEVGPFTLEDFKTAAVRGNIDQLKKCLNQGVPVNEVIRAGWTVLMYAGNYANPEAVTLLLDNGADPNYHADHFSVLMAVCASPNKDQQAICDCAKLLIDHGANVNHFDRYHTSPLICAARDNKALLVKLLIDSGANKDKQDNKGYTALAWAACKGHTRVVRVLIEEGVDHTKATCDGSKAIDLARSNDHTNIATLLRKDNIDAIRQGDTVDLAVKEEMVESDDKDETPISSKHNQYGALEMFLLDAELGGFITTFQENQVTFEAFLRFTDSDLQKLGIKQLGVRKKLLDRISSTHKQEWHQTSLPSIQYNNLLTCPESVAMVVNLGQHAAYMGTSAGYVSDQIKSHPEIIRETKDSTTVLDLARKTEVAMGKVRVLYSELEILRKVIAKETEQKNYEAPDLIKAKKLRRKKTHYKRRIAIVGCLVLIGVTVWKSDTVLGPIINSVQHILAK